MSHVVNNAATQTVENGIHASESVLRFSFKINFPHLSNRAKKRDFTGAPSSDIEVSQEAVQKAMEVQSVAQDAAQTAKVRNSGPYL